MKTVQVYSYTIAALLTLASLNVPLLATNPFEECSKELITYFPEALMNQTMQKFNIPKDKWININKELSEKDKNIVYEVEAQAEKMTPNPLKDPQQRQAAVKLFKNTLFTVFSDTLHKHGITDDKQIQAMLEDLQQQKAKKFAACLEKHKLEMTSTHSQDIQEQNFKQAPDDKQSR